MIDSKKQGKHNIMKKRDGIDRVFEIETTDVRNRTSAIDFCLQIYVF